MLIKSISRVMFTQVICCLSLYIPAYGAQFQPMTLSPARSTPQRLYDCAANSLYVLCSKAKMNVSYASCLEKLPLTERGNSLLEIKRACIEVGFIVEAQRISPDELMDITIPMILWIKGATDEGGSTLSLGHCCVIWPVDEETVQILDYPREPAIYAKTWLIEYLKSKEVAELVILLCRNPEAPTIEEESVKQLRPDIKTTAYTSAGKTWMVIDRNGDRKPQSAIWDFGHIAEGSELVHEFIMRNETEKPLEISNLHKNCKCSGLKSDKSRIAVGERCVITMTISLAGRDMRQAFSGTVVFSPESNVQPVRLLAKGVVHRRIQVELDTLDLGCIEQGVRPVTKRIEIKRTKFADEELQVTKIESKLACFTGNFVSNPKDAETIGELFVTFDPNKAVGVMRSRINIYVNEEQVPAAVCVVTGESVSELVVQPSMLLITRMSRKEGAPLVIRHGNNSRIRLINSICDSNEMAVFETTREMNEEWDRAIRIQVVTSGRMRGIHRGSITFDVAIENNKATSRVKVPFVVVY